MKINWVLRLKNKATVTALVSILIGIISGVVSFGNTIGWWSVAFDSEQATTYATGIVSLVFSLIGGIVGAVIDPTTAGLSDSEQAQTYMEPRKD